VPAINTLGSDIIFLNDHEDEYVLSQSTIDVLEDTSRALKIQDVVKLASNIERWSNKHNSLVSNVHSAYWMKFTITDQSSSLKKWLLEFYDNRLDDISVYIPNEQGGYTVYNGGDSRAFSEKKIQHINYVFDIPNHLNLDSVTIYVRMYSNHELYIYGLVRSVQQFIKYTTYEYFYVTLFYGMLLAMALYNFLIMLTVRERSYFYYIVYVLAVGFYSFARDGFGFQFIWPNNPEVNVFVEPLSLYLLTVSLMMYAREFLNTKVYAPTLDKIMLISVCVRTVFFIVGLFLSSTFIREAYVDVFLIILAYYAGFWTYKKGYKASRYYIIGFTALFCGFAIISLEKVGVPINNVLGFYSFNMGVVIQLIVLSLALADRVKILLKEKAEIREHINLELEEKVKERTLELQDKNEQLDSFVYKASHDIKGPLKSIIGLTKIGIADLENSPKAAEYFDHILKTTTKLDVVVEALLLTTKIKKAKLQFQKIDFEVMVKDVFKTFSHFEGFTRVKLSIKLEEKKIVSDESVLYSIVQNLIENVIKYQDFSKPETYLNVSLHVKEGMAILTFEDNGAGIDAHDLNRIFDMFYKTNNKSTGSGLGLYILKQAIQRLSGNVSVSSKVGEGTTFTIELPQK
jgi:signal transduction histidine kinase